MVIFVLVAFLYLSGTEHSPLAGAASFDTQAACEAKAEAIKAEEQKRTDYQDFQYQCFLLAAPPVRKSA